METLQDLLSHDKALREKQVKFLEENKVTLLEPFEYVALIDCLDIYLATGTNYFQRYKNLIANVRTQHLEEGIKAFYKHQKAFHDNEWDVMDAFKKAIAHRMSEMSFFNLEEVNGFTKADYTHLLESSFDLVKDELDEDKVRLEKYFSFKDFDETEFQHAYEMCVKQLEATRYTAFDVLDMPKNNHYLILQFSGNQAVKIGTPKSLSRWMTDLGEEAELMTYALASINQELASELKVEICLEWSIVSAHAAMVQVGNKRYANLKQAARVYGQLYGLNLSHLKQLVELHELEQHFIGGASVVNKVKLDECVKAFINEKKTP